jgi:hypothetical protein
MHPGHRILDTGKKFITDGPIDFIALSVIVFSYGQGD